MKVTVFGELLLLVGIAAVAYFLYVQQGQLVELELELDRLRGVSQPLPVAESPAPPPKAKRKAAPDA